MATVKYGARRGIVLLDCLAAMGDSMTWRPSIANSYPNLIGTARNFNVVQNAGTDGNHAPQMAARFDADILAWRPGAISIMCGTNDAANLTDVGDFEDAVREMVNKGIDVGARVTICTPPIVRVDARPMETYNDILRTIAGDTAGAVLFDVYERFEIYDTATLDAIYEVDGVHLNASGNGFIRDLANEAANLDAFTINV